MVKVFERLKNAIIVPFTEQSLKISAGDKTIQFGSPEMVKEGLWIWKPRENAIYISQKIIDAAPGSFTEGMTIGNLLNNILLPEHKDPFVSNIMNMLKGSSNKSITAKITVKDSDNPVWIRISARINRYKNNRIKDISGTVEDITAEAVSKEKNTRLLKIKDALLEINHNVATIGDLEKLTELILKRISEAMTDIDCASFLTLNKDNYFTISTSIGYDPEAVKDFKLPYNELFFKKTTAKMYNAPMIVNDVHRIRGRSTPIARTEKNIRIKSLLNTPIRVDNKLVGIISLDSSKNYIFNEEDLEIMQYIKDQIEIAISKYKLYEKIKFISRHDQLTGFINRSYFEEIFDQNRKLAKRYSSSFSLAVMDMDGLKSVNDNYGHMAGDLLIKTFADSLKKYFRESDIFSRFGGDEFLGLFLAMKSSTLEKKFRDFSKELKNSPFEYNGSPITCSFSYGLASFPKEGKTFSELFKLADSRMYKLKTENRQK